MTEHELGRYTGELVLRPLDDGRLMETVLAFGFLDADGYHWSVPVGTTTDGASIPQALWSLTKGPYEGKYRKAAVVHDYYCSVRSADWKAVHLMFYRAMLVAGVSLVRAKLMYVAVYFGGPRWGIQDERNVRLGPPAVPTKIDMDNLLLSVEHDPLMLAVSKAIEREGRAAFDWIASDRRVVDESSEITLHLDILSEVVERDNPSLRDLEAAIDAAVDFTRDAYFAPRVTASPRDVSVGVLLPEG